MRYLCLIYHDASARAALSEREYEELVCEALAYREELQMRGYLVAWSPLQPIESATTIRVRNGRVAITDGPFVETREQLGGFYLIEAWDLNDAIRLASRMPQTRLGCVEVRSLEELGAVCSCRDRRPRFDANTQTA